MRFLAWLLLLLPGAAGASDWVTVSIASYHLDRSGKYQEINPGLGFESELNSRWSFIGGAYSNSHGRVSAYVGAAYMPWRWGRVRFGSVLGLVSGYDDSPMPVVLPALTVERGGLGLNVAFAPKTGDSPGLVGFQVKWKW